MPKEYPDEIKLYDHVANSGIVHIPNRRFPAVAIQGDTLSTMLSKALEMMDKGKQYRDEDLYFSGLELAEQLKDQLAHYEDVLENEGFDRPYSISAKQLELVDNFDTP